MARSDTDAMDLDRKQRLLYDAIDRYGRMAVAFSGGVDSTLLLASAVRQLGDQVLAVTAAAPTHPASERTQAVDLARELNVRHVVIDTDEMQLPDFIANRRDRCYHCKRHILERIRQLEQVPAEAVLAHGANLDDLSDVRPGMQAAEELGVVAPLVDAGLTKNDIRRLARRMGLPNWDRPAMACLATRIPFGTPITAALIQQVADAENLLWDLGVRGARLRHHGQMARIEMDPAQFDLVMTADVRRQLVDDLHRIGYEIVCLDLEGYQSGKMNRLKGE